jgi:hypothetical protein
VCPPRSAVDESLAAVSVVEPAASSFPDPNPCPVEVVVTVVVSPERFPEPMVCPPSYTGEAGAEVVAVGSPHAAAPRRSKAAKRMRIVIVGPWQERNGA